MHRVVSDLRMGESQNSESGGGQCLVSLPVLGLLSRRPVIAQPVGLNHEPQLRPKEIHTETIHMPLRFRLRQPRLPNQPQESSFQFRVTQGEGVPIQDPP